MGKSIIIPGADFSANNVGNAFYPFYESLVGARFYGSSVVGGAALKKSSQPGAITAGSGLGAPTTGPYSYGLISGQGFDTELPVPAVCTIVAIAAIFGNENAGMKKFGGTESIQSSGPFAGKFAISALAGSNTRMISTLAINGAAATPFVEVVADAKVEQNFMTFSMIDSTEGVMAYTHELWCRGGVARGSSTFTSALTPGLTLRAENNHGQGAGVKHRHMAVFNRVLTQAERGVVRDWLRGYYAPRGIMVG